MPNEVEASKKGLFEEVTFEGEQSWPGEDGVKSLPRRRSGMCKDPETEAPASVAGLWPVRRRGHGRGWGLREGF